MKKMSLRGKIILSVISGIAFAFLFFYFAIPAINPAYSGFWVSLTLIILAFAYPFLFTSGDGSVGKREEKRNKYKNGPIRVNFNFGGSKMSKIALLWNGYT